MNEKISGYTLDKQQQEIVLDDSNHLLVVAGAGSGKTLTILGKIYYLVEKKKVSPDEILCISFTRASANSLKEKIEKEFSYQMPIYTFHKLALEILKEGNDSYQIADSNTLEHIIHEFFAITILDYPNYLTTVLKYFHKNAKKDLKNTYQLFYKYHYQQIELLERLLSTFLHLLKCNHYQLESFPIFLKRIKRTISYKKYHKEKLFLILALNFYLEYQNYLETNNEMDFDDMIFYATNHVHENGIQKKYKYVIIDEYQDTSYVRFLLIKEILLKTNAKFMVVGDDFQSIYRFTGCDLSLFLDFKKYFPDASIKKIENTYRNSQELIKIAGNFVMKNKKQIFYISFISAIVTILLSVIIFLLLVRVDVDISKLEMPVVYVVSNMFKILRCIYGVIILGSIFTTAISLGVSFLQNTAKNKKSYTQIAIIMCITSVIISKFGFSNLVSLLYPIFGYLGLIQILRLCVIKISKVTVR